MLNVVFIIDVLDGILYFLLLIQAEHSCLKNEAMYQHLLCMYVGFHNMNIN